MKKLFNRVVCLTACLSLLTLNVAFAGGSIGYGNINVLKDDKVVTKLNGQNPIEDKSVLVCDGKCMIKSEGISLIGAAGSVISVDNQPDTFNLAIKEGKVDFVINNNTRKIAFHTPDGTYTVAEVVFDASSTPVVKGYVAVTEDGNVDIEVTEGRMVFASAEGMQAVDANQKIVLAQAAATAAWVPWVVGGGLVVAVVAVAAAQDDDDDAPAPPADAPDAPDTPADTPSAPSAPRPPAPPLSPAQ